MTSKHGSTDSPSLFFTFSTDGCMELVISLLIKPTHLGAQVVGSQLLSNHAKPP